MMKPEDGKKKPAPNETSTERVSGAPPEGPIARPQGVLVLVQWRNGEKAERLAPGKALVVGRCESSDLSIPDDSLSRRHARFSLEDGRIFVEDLGSTNGTSINGQPVTRAEVALSGEVMLGSYIIAQFSGLGVASAVDGSMTHESAHVVTAHAAVPASSQAWTESDATTCATRIIAGAAMREVLDTAKRVADSQLSVLLHGETGTGKELVARSIHDRSPRRGKPLVSVNCGAIAATLALSTLFGHEKGAFTSAEQQQRGVFEEANKGTLFLDEIGELPAEAQAALLRVLETKKFCRVGSAREVSADVRIIAATHRDLKAMSEEGSFREDLYYRLSEMVIEIPPLRDRRDEIASLCARFLEEENKVHARRVLGIAAEAMALLEAYAWPGNVRQLRNVIGRAVVMARGEQIQPEDLPQEVRAPEGAGRQDLRTMDAKTSQPSRAGKALVQTYEAQMLRGVLEACNWNRAEAARRLGMPRRTLANKIEKYGLKPPKR